MVVKTLCFSFASNEQTVYIREYRYAHVFSSVEFHERPKLLISSIMLASSNDIHNFEMNVKVNCIKHKVLITAKLLCRDCQIDMKCYIVNILATDSEQDY